ncbi:MAG TPA: SRPBCC family protein [Acidimicrobiales bacterium]|nr:SRPBCC family protein [Acidimicrobiales bacterium]
MTYSVAESRRIAAPAVTLWSMVADLARMGEWSPENKGGRWVRGDGPVVGALFRGRNKSGIRRWSTTARVVDADPGKSFEITVTFANFPVANWRYEFEVVPEGCVVTESWRDNRSAWQRVVGRTMGDHSGAHARQQMAATLAKLASVAESDGQGGQPDPSG